MKRKSDFELRDVADMGIIVPLGKLNCNALMTLNETGIMIWNLLENDCTIEQIVKAVADEYDADEKDIAADVNKFIAKLESAGLLDE